MARRFSRGIEYGRARFRSGWTAVTLPSLTEKLQGQPLFLAAAQNLRLRSAVPAGRRILRRRDRIKRLEADNEVDRKQIEEIFGPGVLREQGIVGVVSHRGKKPFRVMVAEQTGYRVAKGRELCEWLGEDAAEVLTGATINPAVFSEPEELLKLLKLLQEHFPKRFESLVELTFSAKKLDKVAEEREKDPPEGTIKEKEPTYRVLTELKA